MFWCGAAVAQTPAPWEKELFKPWSTTPNITIFALPKIPHALDLAFGPCGDPCIVTRSPGGYIYLFEQAAHQVLEGEKRLVVIDGDCYSACTIFADLARSRVCITQMAVFYFHKAYYTDTRMVAGVEQVIHTDLFDPPQSPDIDKAVRALGGYPADGFTSMPYAIAKDFWRTCTITSPPPRGINAHSLY
jgi:hypothetical protein